MQKRTRLMLGNSSKLVVAPYSKQSVGFCSQMVIGERVIGIRTGTAPSAVDS